MSKFYDFSTNLQYWKVQKRMKEVDMKGKERGRKGGEQSREK